MAATQAPAATAEETRRFDPFDAFRQMRDTYLDAMSKSMIDVVNTEAYAKSTGALLDSTLTASEPVREAIDKAMAQALQGLSLPSREDVLRLAERFSNLELRLDDLDIRFDRLEAALAGLTGLPEQLARITSVLQESSAFREPSRAIEAQPAAEQAASSESEGARTAQPEPAAVPVAAPHEDAARAAVSKHKRKSRSRGQH